MKCAFYFMGLAVLLIAFPACAEGEKHYNFQTRPTITAPTPAPEAKPETADTEEVAKPEAQEPLEEKKAEEKAPPTKPRPHISSAAPDDASERLVRFFIGSCLKFYGKNNALKKYMDDKFLPLEKERIAAFAPVIDGTADTVYWDVVLDKLYLILAKNMASGKCDVIAKEARSAEVHSELKAVMDGLTLTKVLDTQTDFETLPAKNKSVTTVDIKGHPLEKELGIVATTKIKDEGDNIAAILSLFAIPQESVEITQKAAP